MSVLAVDASRPGAVRGFLRLVVIEHSVFALPFAYIAALTAMYAAVVDSHALGTFYDVGGDVLWRDLAIITVAMVSARTFAMAANRVIDRGLDARNPRTAGRELVTGAVSIRTVHGGMAISLAVFLTAAWLLAPICLALAPVVLLLLALYPYAKRFTWAAHYVLGLAQAVAPVGAWVAVADGLGPARVALELPPEARAYSAPFLAPILLGLAVGTWMAGFDIIYACQDLESDRREGVHSIPARFGVARALVVSTLTHVITVVLLLAFGGIAGFDSFWYLGVLLAAGALAYEHAIVRPDDLSRVNRAFFTVNGWIAVGLLAFAILDLAIRGLTW